MKTLYLGAFPKYRRPYVHQHAHPDPVSPLKPLNVRRLTDSRQAARLDCAWRQQAGPIYQYNNLLDAERRIAECSRAIFDITTMNRLRHEHRAHIMGKKVGFRGIVDMTGPSSSLHQHRGLPGNSPVIYQRGTIRGRVIRPEPDLRALAKPEAKVMASPV